MKLWWLSSCIECICMAFLHCAFSSVSSKRLHKRMQSHIGCICLIFLHCEFSNGSSNDQPEKRHSHIGCISLTFLQCMFSNVSLKNQWTELLCIQRNEEYGKTRKCPHDPLFWATVPPPRYMSNKSRPNICQLQHIPFIVATNICVTTFISRCNNKYLIFTLLQPIRIVTRIMCCNNIVTTDTCCNNIDTTHCL